MTEAEEVVGVRANPIAVKLRAAKAALVAGEPGAQDRYAAALHADFEADARWAETASTPELVHWRRIMAMRVAFEVYHPPLAAIAIGFKATVEELREAFDGLPALAPPADEVRVGQLRRLPYEAYLRTPHWRQVRAAALERFENQCALCCSGRELEVHHRTYENLGCERPADVTVLCATCHARFHDVERKAA